MVIQTDNLVIHPDTGKVPIFDLLTSIMVNSLWKTLCLNDLVKGHTPDSYPLDLSFHLDTILPFLDISLFKMCVLLAWPIKYLGLEERPF